MLTVSRTVDLPAVCDGIVTIAWTYCVSPVNETLAHYYLFTMVTRDLFIGPHGNSM